MPPSLDIPLGQVIRIPCKFIKGTSKTPKLQIEAIAKVLQETGKNVLPLLVKPKGDNRYEALSNIQILDAAKQAKLDFVWCIAVNSDMAAQIEVETGQIVKINMLSASEAELTEFFDYLKHHELPFKRIEPVRVAKAIVNYRKESTPKNLTFLTKQRCGIGKAKIQPLSKFLVLA